MFREMRRKAQQLTEAECEDILNNATSGVLGVFGDDGYPYTVPVSHVFYDGKIAFHCAKEGHKIDAMMNNPKASFCVYDEGYQEPGDWALYIQSVVVFGKIEIIEEQEKIYEISRQLSLKFTDDHDYIEREIKNSGPGTFMFALVPEHITGKRVHEA